MPARFLLPVALLSLACAESAAPSSLDTAQADGGGPAEQECSSGNVEAPSAVYFTLPSTDSLYLAEECVAPDEQCIQAKTTRQGRDLRVSCSDGASTLARVVVR